jgi:predicted enzyme related to lactoylglutathione lyase
MAAHGRFGWNELNTHDPEAGKRFCQSVFGWTWEAMPTPVLGGGTYWVAKSGDEFVAGLFPLAAPELAQVPDHWLSYLAVDDVDARAAQATAAGGSLIREPWTVPDVGRICILRLPGGAAMGLMSQSGQASN